MIKYGDGCWTGLEGLGCTITTCCCTGLVVVVLKEPCGVVVLKEPRGLGELTSGWRVVEGLKEPVEVRRLFNDATAVLDFDSFGEACETLAVAVAVFLDNKDSTSGTTMSLGYNTLLFMRAHCFLSWAATPVLDSLLILYRVRGLKTLSSSSSMDFHL